VINIQWSLCDNWYWKIISPAQALMYDIKINKVHPRNYTKKLNESSSTEKLGMHSVINKLQRLGKSTWSRFYWFKYRLNSNRYTIRLVICFLHRRLSSFLNIDQICCAVPYSLDYKQCIYQRLYTVGKASFSWIKGCRTSNTAWCR
jgi:hypothetical protein